MISEIATHVAGIRRDALSPAARDRLKLCILANFAVGVAGVPYAFPPEPEGDGRYGLLSGRRARSAEEAAFWNAAAMHARTQDDFDPVGNLHVGTVVLPALMAVADEQPMTGAAFLDATLAGYVTAVGLARYASPKTTPRGLRSTGFFSPFGASAAVAKARGLDRDALASALAMTTVFAGGTTQSWIDGGHEWQLHVGHAAATGLRCAGLAAQGMRASSGALTGTAGLFPALVGEAPDFASIADGFDPETVALESVIKRYPVSGICQSVVLAAERLVAEGVDPEAVAFVLVEMNSFEIGYPGTRNPGNGLKTFGERLMSAAFNAASVIAAKGFDFSDFHAASNPARERIAETVEVRPDPELPLLSSRITLTLNDGTQVVREVINSRDEVEIDRQSIVPWGRALYAEIGRPEADFDALAAMIGGLEFRDQVTSDLFLSPAPVPAA